MNVVPHTDFKFHPLITQIGCYWGGGGHTELYLLEGDRLAIVDTGVADTPDAYVAPALAAMGRRLADIDVIINTHGHYDHAGGNARVVEESQAEIWMPPQDVAIAEDPNHQFTAYFAQSDVLIGREDRLEASRESICQQAGGLAKVTRTFNDGDSIDLGRGLVLTVIHVPGHTQGSSCFYLERDGLLIAGDAVLGAGSRPGGLPLIYFPDDYERSLDLLETLDLNLLCLGHHYRSLSLTRESVKYGRDGKRFIRESREIAHRIAEAIDTASRDRSQPFLDAAQKASRALVGPLSLILDPETGLAQSQGVPALFAYWSAAH